MDRESNAWSATCRVDAADLLALARENSRRWNGNGYLSPLYALCTVHHRREVRLHWISVGLYRRSGIVLYGSARSLVIGNRKYRSTTHDCTQTSQVSSAVCFQLPLHPRSQSHNAMFVHKQISVTVHSVYSAFDSNCNAGTVPVQSFVRAKKEVLRISPCN
jgi:hypothetical protein